MEQSMEQFTGVFDILDGKIIEEITHEEAMHVKFKHPQMFSDKANLGYKECRYGRFIIDNTQLILQSRDMIERFEKIGRVVAGQLKHKFTDIIHGYKRIKV